MKYKNVIWKRTMKEEHISIYRTMLRRNNAWIRKSPGTWLRKCYKLFVQTLLKTCLNGLLKKKMDCLLLFRPFLEWQRWVLSIYPLPPDVEYGMSGAVYLWLGNMPTSAWGADMLETWLENASFQWCSGGKLLVHLPHWACWQSHLKETRRQR